MRVFILLYLLVAMFSVGGVLVTLSSRSDSGGYPLTFAGSSVVQSETLFVFVRCVTNNKRPLPWPKYGRFLNANCLKKARKLFKKEKSCTKSEKLLDGLKVAQNLKSCSKVVKQLMNNPTHISAAHISAPHISAAHISALYISAPHISAAHISALYISAPHISAAHISAPLISAPYIKCAKFIVYK